MTWDSKDRRLGYRCAAALAFGAVAAMAGITVYAAGGAKSTSEKCATDDECKKGHCHTKKDGDKVCVDCSSQKIEDTRRMIEKYCHDDDRDYPRGCRDLPRTEEIAEKWFTLRIENATTCINIRKDENSSCWDGGNPGHRDQVDQTEAARATCYKELNTRQGNGGIYDCSDSTYASLANDEAKACSSWGRGCQEWSTDSKEINCREVEDAMKKPLECTAAIENLDRNCLPRLSSQRESQYSKAMKAVDYCKEVLRYKNDNKLCK